MARRSSEVELCFDSMTDLITNLAGGLILVVMLLIGLTREAPTTLENRPAAGTGKQNDSEKSTRALGERLNNLQVDTARVNIDITSDEQLLKKLDQEATELIERTMAAGRAPMNAPEKK